MDPATLSAAAIATLVITKAFEKTGEVLGEKALEQAGKLVQLLQKRFPKASTALARVEEKPKDWGEAFLEAEAEVKAAADKDTEVAETVQAIADEVKSQPTLNQTIKNIVSGNHKVHQSGSGNISLGNIAQAGNITFGSTTQAKD
jgi:lipopolysaccharide biosynthesis regulator YciM